MKALAIVSLAFTAAGIWECVNHFHWFACLMSGCGLILGITLATADRKPKQKTIYKGRPIK